MRAAEAVRDGQGVGDGLGRQHRRHDGLGAAADGPDQGRQAPGDRHPDPGARLDARRCCSTPAPTPRSSPSGSCSSPRWASVYARHRFDIDEPRVGLLSIGEEPGKGDSLRKEAFALLQDAPGIDFIGNVEGRDMMTDAVDVVVTDGFTGNVALKTLEGGVKAVIAALLAAFAEPSLPASTPTRCMPALLPLYAPLDPDTYGGAMLLGVDGVCIISHGSTGATAMRNAIGVADEMVEHGMVDEIRAAVAPS